MKKFFIFIIALSVLSFCFLSCQAKKLKPLPDPLVLSFTVTPASTAEAADGAIDLQVDGGPPPYSYLWSNRAVTEDIAGLKPGIYHVAVMNDEDQMGIDSVRVWSLDREGTVVDVDGNAYHTVKIGNQWWMAENLRVTHDAQGNAITSYLYNNNPAHEAVYGRLYTWQDVMNGESGEGAQGIAPDGWHIPSDADWQELFNTLGGIALAGAKLKTIGHNHWVEMTENATNETGFSGLPAGGGDANGVYEGMGYGTHFWSSRNRGENILAPTLHCDPSVLLLELPKTMRISVRCVKD